MDKLTPCISVLITDSEDDKLLSLQVVNCLSLHKDVKVYILSSKKNNHLRYSRRIEHFSYYTECDPEEWVERINEEVERYNIDIVLPVYDRWTETLIRYQDLLKENTRLSILPNLNSYKIASNKGLLYQHLKAHNLPCPQSKIVSPKAIPDLEGLDLPLIAKPVIGFSGGRRIKVLRTDKELINYYETIDYNCNTIYQDYINGYDLSCNIICRDGELIAHTIQSTRLSQKDDLEPQSHFTFIHEPDLLELLKKIAKSLDWSGPANIDIRYSTDDGQFKIIEINPRYWINVDASAMADVNFPYLHCRLTLDLPINEKIKSQSISYYNFRGMVRELIKNPLSIFKFRFLRHHTPLKFALKDPFPMFYIFIWRTKNVILNRVR